MSAIESASELTATAVLLMMPRLARAPVAVLVDGEVPSSLRLDVFEAKDVFVRLRSGASAHGLEEPYGELGVDEYPAESTPALVVSPAHFVQSRFPHSASVFGAVDVTAFVPRSPTGSPFVRVRVPIPSLDRDSWHEFELVARSRVECRYRVAGGDRASRGEQDAVSTR